MLTPLLLSFTLAGFLGLFEDTKGKELERLHTHMTQTQASVETLTRQNQALLKELDKQHEENNQLRWTVAALAVLAVLSLLVGVGIGSKARKDSQTRFTTYEVT